MATPRQIAVNEAVVTARDNGEEVSAKVYMCPDCEEAFGPPLFVVFQIAGHTHVHLQCVYCDETFCSGEECAPPEKKIVIVPG